MRFSTLRTIAAALLFLTLLPVGLACGEPPPRDRRLILVDPSHGGQDAGVKLTGSLSEKDVTLAIALQVQKSFSPSDRVQVQLLRTTDTALSTAERVRLIKSLQPQGLLVLHVNAGFEKKAAGYELYFPGFKRPSDGKDDAQAIVGAMSKNKHLNDSVRLSQHIQKNLAGVLPRKDRGLREVPIPILEGIAIPAVVLEIGFATSPEDRKALLDEGLQRAIGQALGKSLREVFAP